MPLTWNDLSTVLDWRNFCFLRELTDVVTSTRTTPIALLLLLGCTVETEPGRTGKAAFPPLVAQRVTATVRRSARQLVRLETEREAFLTTPEHPFATPRSGWVDAGRLMPGDWVVSEGFGAVRLRSVRSQPTTLSVPVFNLSVASSHAYFVGTERVLVHNTACSPDPSASPKEADALDQTLERLLREREVLNREIRALTPSLSVAEAKTQRRKLQRQIDALRKRRVTLGLVAPRQVTPLAEKHRANHEAARKALEDAKDELAELERRTPTSETETTTQTARREALRKQIPSLELSSARTGKIVNLLGELERLQSARVSKRARVSAGPSQDPDVSPVAGASGALQARKKELRAELSVELQRERRLQHKRKKSADPEWRKKNAEYERKLKGRLERSARHLADTERPPDRLELLESELARRLEDEPSESRQLQIDHLSAQIDAMRRLVEIRREQHRLRVRRHRASERREQLITTGGDTSKVEEKLEKLEKRLEQQEREHHALRLEYTRLRVKLRQLALHGPTPGADAPDALEEVTLRELARQPPSPERSAALQSSYERLQQELREERTAVEGALSAMANEYAHIQTTQAGSSSGPTWQARLKAIQEEQGMLLAQWRARLHLRLDSTRRQLSLLQSSPALRDDEVLHDLEREIALLERELQVSG